MACKYHQTTAAINTCKKCGFELCDDCVVPFRGVHLCKDCLAEEMKAHPHSGAPMPPRPLPPRPHDCHGHPGCEPRKKRISRFLLLCCSMLPGANYMFMGLIKRGLFVMSSFFFTIFLISLFHRSEPVAILMSFACGMIFITSFFDGFAIRRRIVSGEIVEDSVKEITDFLSRHRAKLVVGAVAVTLLGVLSYILDMLRSFGFSRFARMMAMPEFSSSNVFYNGAHAYTYVGFNPASLLPCAVILVFIFFIIKHFRSKSRRSRYDRRDMNHDIDRHE